MIFRIVSFNRERDVYGVISNEGEQKNVTSFQIVNVMLQGYVFDNAYLTQKGFAVQTNTGTRYFQANLDRNTQMLVNKFLAARKNQEQQLREQQKREAELAEQQRQKLLREQQLREQQLREQQLREQQLREQQQRKLQEQQRQAQLREQEQRKKQEQTSKVIVDKTKTQRGTSVKINGTNRSQKISYRGDLYISDTQLCKKYNADVDEFRKLREKGYSIDEALGLKPLRPENELVSLKQLNKVLDSMAAQRGEY